MVTSPSVTGTLVGEVGKSPGPGGGLVLPGWFQAPLVLMSRLWSFAAWEDVPWNVSCEECVRVLGCVRLGDETK